MNVIYITSTRRWLNISNYLKTKGIHPVYWICRDRHDMPRKISVEFPNVDIQTRFEAAQGIFPEEVNFQDDFPYILDEMLLDRFTDLESTVLKMMDRLDPSGIGGVHFTYNERVRLYHRMLAYYLRILETNNPRALICEDVPHEIGQYILYFIMKKLGKYVLIVKRTPFNNGFVIDNKETNRYRLYLSINSKKSLKEVLNKKGPAGLYSQRFANKKYMKKPRAVHDLSIGHMRKYYNRIANEIGHSRGDNLKISSRPVEEQAVTNIQWYVYRIRSMFHKRNMRKYYEGMSDMPDLNSEFVYVPLQFQPERTTSPEAGQYVHQYLIINMLSKTLPSDICIYVKEHPNQFSLSFTGERGRSRQLYMDINKLRGVRFLPLDSDSGSLIESSKFVATGTGTAGWEAINQRKPCICFGDPWYKNAPGVFIVKSVEDLSESIDSILNVGVGKQNSIKDWMLEECVTMDEIPHFPDVDSKSENSKNSFLARALLTELNLLRKGGDSDT